MQGCVHNIVWKKKIGYLSHGEGSGMRKALLISFCLVCILSTAAAAGNNPDAKVAIHVRVHTAKGDCNTAFDPATGTCLDLVTTVAGFSFDAFPVFFDLTEYKGCAYALTWPDWASSAAFNNCADFVIGGIVWPGPASYAAHTWTECQSGICVPAYLWLYADGPGEICALDPDEAELGLEILDCAEGQDVPVGACCAGVYGASGDDACNCPKYNATLPTTWGEIKSFFK